MDLWTAFILGLAGSIHCAGMCGPLALALPGVGRTVTGYVFGRVLYNLGRMVTYCLMGLAFGLVGKTFLMAGLQRWVSIVLGVVLLLGLLLSRKVTWSLPVTKLVGRFKGGLSSLLQRRSPSSLALLGILNGLLPCGLVYVACAGAAATGEVVAGAQYMAAFGLGTVPMMLGISLSGRLIHTSLRLKLNKLVPAAVGLVAVLLILRGMSLGIPYLSPDLSADSCCHSTPQDAAPADEATGDEAQPPGF